MNKRYAFLRMQYGANIVIAECGPCSFDHALEQFRKMAPGLEIDGTGYVKFNDDISFCIAEYHENFAILP